MLDKPENEGSLLANSDAEPTRLIMTSHSIDGTFESCPRRFEFMHGWLKAPERESNKFAADVGTAIHEGVQEWQRQLHAGKSHETASALGELALLRWWPWIGEAQRIADGGTIGLRTLGNGLLLLSAIIEHPLWNDWELVEVEGFGPAIEVPWRIVHKSLGVVTAPSGEPAYFATQGKIDFILRHKRLGTYRIWDIKTTEKALPAHDAAFRFSGQAGQYGLVLDHALGLNWEQNGLDITYLIAMFDADGPVVYPLTYKLDPEEIQDSIDVKVERLLRMRAYCETGHWPRRAHGCEFYGVPCGFLDICQRRDNDFIAEWFEFETAAGRFSDYDRVYEPVWTLEA